MDLKRFKTKATGKVPENKKFLLGFKRKDSGDVDKAFHQLHDEVFAETDCLTCANCCKTTSPIFYQNDVDRLAKTMRMKPGEFISKYLRTDEDNDMVLHAAPCPFLGLDNYCSVYEDRPKACREYPHTHRKKMVQILDLTLRNTTVCPAVFEIVERLKRIEL